MARRGRPKKQITRSKAFKVRFTSEDEYKLEAAARSKGVTKSELIREAVDFYYQYGHYLG